MKKEAIGQMRDNLKKTKRNHLQMIENFCQWQRLYGTGFPKIEHDNQNK